LLQHFKIAVGPGKNCCWFFSVVP